MRPEARVGEGGGWRGGGGKAIIQYIFQPVSTKPIRCPIVYMCMNLCVYLSLLSLGVSIPKENIPATHRTTGNSPLCQYFFDYPANSLLVSTHTDQIRVPR